MLSTHAAASDHRSGQAKPTGAILPAWRDKIRVERMRLLLASALPLNLAGCAVAIAFAALLHHSEQWPYATIWVLLCAAGALIRVGHTLAWRRAQAPAHKGWLISLTVVCGLQGLAWGLAGWWQPMNSMVASSLIVTVLATSCALNTLTLQAHAWPSLTMNIPLLAPAIIMLLARQDAYGVFGGGGVLILGLLMTIEARRTERRISELLWLRYTYDDLAEERAQALQAAQHHSAIKDQFLATMSHEMRTPLHGILGVTQLVQKQLAQAPEPLRGEAEAQLSLIEHTGEHLLGLINDLLDFARIEAGKLRIDHRSFDAQATLREVLALQDVRAKEKGLTLGAHIDLPSPCLIEGDPTRLSQLLHNLLGNAIKFTEAGQVLLTVQRASQQPDAMMLLTVEDSGIGMAADQLDKIFEPFHQIEAESGKRQQGTGLGLAISRELARAMGGDITCTSTPGVGSTFTLTLPLPTAFMAQAPSSAAPHQPVASDPSTLRGHVLLAEDNPVNALVAEAALVQIGMQVTRVDNGHAALRALQADHGAFDMVLMDCQMPELDGLEATRRLRAWEQAQQHLPKPVIALTANALEGDLARCRDAGMDGHLPKPFKQQDLHAVLQAFLSPGLTA
ncbi:ATP-binding protein [Aquabacterium sp.]|uniref:ATP-binding protein n=1 Tax=Aquabacterium sp. TaxID=1872578 RepID=UPI003B6C56C9